MTPKDTQQENEFDEFVGQNPVEDQLNTILRLVSAVQKLQRRVAKNEARSTDTVEIKTTTGDYADATSWDGRRVLNTFDDNYKIFADGAWRTIVAY